MKKLILISALFILGGCSTQQDANFKTAVTNLQGEVNNVVAAIVAKAKQDCPTVIAMMPNAQLLTAFAFTALGLPASGTVAVGLESSVATVCGRLIVDPTAASTVVAK